MERLNLIVYTSSCGNYKRTMRPISNLHKAHCIVLHEGLMDLVSLPFKKKPPQNCSNEYYRDKIVNFVDAVSMSIGLMLQVI